MSSNLNDFTTQQLQILLNTVVARFIEVQAKSDYMKGICEACELVYPSTELEKEVEFERETLSLFRVQILNAVAEVDKVEFIGSN